MVTLPFLYGSTGLNNKVDAHRLPYNRESGVSALAEAVNVDIDDSGAICRRLGQELVSAGVYHSAFCDGGDAFVVHDRTNDAAIMRVNTDFSLAGVVSGLSKGVRVSFAQVGGQTWYSNGIQHGVITDGVSVAWPSAVHTGAAQTLRALTNAPVGHVIAWHGARMWIAVEDGSHHVIYVTEPYNYGTVDPARRGFAFGTKVRMLRPVAGGMWVSDAEQTGFIPDADNFEGTRWIQRAAVPAHEYSACCSLIDLSASLEIPGLSAVWSSDEGLCIGTEDGRLIVVTDGKLIYPSGGQGATVVFEDKVINTVS